MLARLIENLKTASRRVFVRATFYAFLGLLVFSLTLIAVNYQLQYSRVVDRLEIEAREKAELVTNIAAREIENKNYGEVERLLNALAREQYVIAAKAYGRFGQEFASDFLSSLPTSEPQFSELALDAAQYRAPQHAETSEMIEYVLPAFRGGDAVGSVLVRMSKEEVQFLQRQAQLQVISILGVLMLAFVPLLGWLMYRATDGISRVTQAANEASEGYLDCNLKIDGVGEIKDLQTAFRQMMINLRDNILKIESLAYSDRITRLPNRAMLDKVAMMTIDMRPGATGALVYVGLDRFKMINDLHGHRIGDQLLLLLGERLSNLVDQVAALHTSHPPTVARFSGDEFVVLLPGLSDPEILKTVSDQVVERMGASLKVDQLALSVTASAGIVIYPDHGVTAEEVLRNANMAMREAKARGRAKVIKYNDAIRRQMTEKDQIASRLMEAVQNQALSVHYQPKINLKDGSITGSEALLRWNDPEMGTVPPFKFIPVAEENGLIAPIGEFVLQTALDDLRSLREADNNISVAVNVSPVQLQNAEFTNRFLGIIGESGVDTTAIELEITESSLLEYSEQVLNIIMPLKDEGVKLAIDDFGTGYSSLSSLANMPFDTLKIDRSFIMDIDSCEDRRAIVELILMMARQLKLDTVSEGIETKLQRDYIDLWGGSLGQGFLWSPAVPIDEFADMVLAAKTKRVAMEPGSLAV